MKYRIGYSPETEGHLQALTRRQQVIVLDTVEKQLQYQPAVETMNRKLMRPNPIAPWELRIRSLRVYYDVDEGEYAVYILAVGVKERNNVKIGKEVIKL
ncbi:MAG: type II toxin-antitoxin system RelE/ParE family toxin [Nitrospirae bacterium]|nr:type II toxin-antitoxin system RelE/ParE family toxin [Nitrospirota bacterium]